MTSRCGALLLAGVGLTCTLAPLPARAGDEAVPRAALRVPTGAERYQRTRLPKESTAAAIYRGQQVFATYCTSCHTPSAPLPPELRTTRSQPAGITLSNTARTYAELESIVRDGLPTDGSAVFNLVRMPPWDGQLTDEQVDDLVTYLLSTRSTLED